jgi:hypothetical protein
LVVAELRGSLLDIHEVYQPTEPSTWRLDQAGEPTCWTPSTASQFIRYVLMVNSLALCQHQLRGHPSPRAAA